MNAHGRRVCLTDLGFCGLWDAAHFPMVYDQASWQAEIGDEMSLQRHVVGGFLVPIRVNCPGSFDFEVRVSWSDELADLTPRERLLVVASSPKYLFRSSGRVCFGGLECVDCVPSANAGALDIEPGDYECRVHLVAWNEEPDCLDASGMKSNEALPDFVVLLNRAEASFMGATTLQTFR